MILNLLSFLYFCTVFRMRHEHIAQLSLSNLHLVMKIIRANLFTKEYAPYSSDFPYVKRGSARSDRENGDGLVCFLK